VKSSPLRRLRPRLCSVFPGAIVPEWTLVDWRSRTEPAHDGGEWLYWPPERPLDELACPRCGGRMSVIATIEAERSCARFSATSAFRPSRRSCCRLARLP